MTPRAFLVGLVFGLALTAGCAARKPDCYGLVGVNPPSRFAIVFDSCSGSVEYRNLPPLPTEHARPEA